MKLIFIYGLPGVGKLTVANELSNVTGFKIFHNHLAIEMISSVFKFGSEPFIKLREKTWLDMFKYAQKYKSPGLIFTFVFEKTVANDFIEKVKKTMNKNSEVYFVKLVCQQDEHNKRIIDDSRTKFEGKIRSVDKYNKLIESGQLFNPENNNDVLEIDNTFLTPKDVSSKICSHFKINPSNSDAI